MAVVTRRSSLPDNASVLFCPIGDSAYVGTIAEQDKKFDVVIVDAEEQVKCMLNAADFLTDRGVIILDDAAVEGLLSRGFRVMPFDGMKAGGINVYRTSIFYRDNNCLGI
jgi:predicted O-methyltransferase YrrM